MAEYNNSIQTLWAHQAARFCEGVSGAEIPVGKSNAYGRLPFNNILPDISWTAGMAAGGLRATAFIPALELERQLHALYHAVRTHVPMVLICPATHDSDVVKCAADSGAFLFKAQNAKEVLDFTLIAHKISEQSLVPGIVCFNAETPLDNALIQKDNAFLISFCGSPDEVVAVSTPAQEMVFGSLRRRLPRWHSADTSVLTGAPLAHRTAAYAAEAHRRFFLSHIDELTSKILLEFQAAGGEKYMLQPSHSKKADTLVVSADASLLEQIGGIKLSGGLSVMHLQQLWPLSDAWTKSFSFAKRIVVLDATSKGQATLFEKIAAETTGNKISLFSGYYAQIPSRQSFEAFLNAVVTDKLSKVSHPLDIHLQLANSDFPKHEVLLQTLRRAYPEIGKQSFATSDQMPREIPPSIPVSVRRYADRGPVFSKVSNFFDQEAFFTDTRSAEWVLSPAQAIAAMPPASAGFGITASQRTLTPVFKPQTCTGCGDCAVYCPYSALPALAITFSDLIKTGIDISRKSGAVIGKLVPIQKQWAQLCALAAAEACRAADPGSTPTRAGIFLANTLDSLILKAGSDEEKSNALRVECAAVIQSVGELKVAVSKQLFLTPHETESGTGALFSLAFDTNACTGCGICAEICAEDALEMRAQNPLLNTELNSEYVLWEKIPDTSADIIERLLAVEDYSPLSALSLSRNYYLSMSGGGDKQLASQRAVLHLTLVVAEAILQPGIKALVKKVETFIESISSELTGAFVGAMPVGLQGELSKALADIKTGKVSVDELLQHPDLQTGRKLLDTEMLSRKTGLINELLLLKDLLSEGPTGTGRARLSLVLDASLQSLVAYPENPFTAPVTFWDSRSAQMARGLVSAHERHALDEIRLLRKALREAEGDYNPLIHNREIEALTWETITEEERRHVQPLLFVAGREIMHREGLSVVSELCTSGRPVKVLLLDEGAHNFQGGDEWATSQAAVLSLMAAGHVQVTRTSLADHRHLFNTLVNGFKENTAVFWWVLTPGKTRVFGGQTLHEFALYTRAFTQFDYLPERPGNMFSTRLHIDRNPASEDKRFTTLLKYSDANGEQSVSYAMTPADWFYHFGENAHHFSPVDPLNENVVSVDVYLSLASDERKGKLPAVYRVDGAGNLKAYAVSVDIIRRVSVLDNAWQLLREIAGTLTEFPEKLSAKARIEADAAYIAEKEKLVSDYESRITGLEAEYLAKIRYKLHEKLVALSLSQTPN